MQANRKRRLYFILILLISLSSALALALFALKQNINLYYTPSELSKQENLSNQELRVGGYVIKGSLQHQPHSLKVQFVLTDFHAKMVVMYDGILPSLFREGQGIVAQGKMNAAGILVADQVLAKHDSTYRPPGFSSQRQAPEAKAAVKSVFKSGISHMDKNKI
jgi:cytochrome c-type biogenesis protein CcmE